MPVVTLIGGPNGSGKSRLIRDLRERGADFGEHLNADTIASLRSGGRPVSRTTGLAAQAEVRNRRAAALAARRDYSWETVMSHASHIEHLASARDAGYEVRVIYVAIADPLVNIARVVERVGSGGHDVPHDAVLRRYWKSIANLSAAIVISDRARVFDNSFAFEPFVPVASFDERVLRLSIDPIPEWFRSTCRDLQSYRAR